MSGLAALFACSEEAGSSDMEFVCVAGGTFTPGMMPAQVDAAYADLACDEQWFESFRRIMGPPHQVMLTGIEMASTPVTQTQWEAVMGTSVREQLELADPEMYGPGEGPTIPCTA